MDPLAHCVFLVLDQDGLDNYTNEQLDAACTAAGLEKVWATPKGVYAEDPEVFREMEEARDQRARDEMEREEALWGPR